jgi:uncharacterized membrane protein
MAKVLPEAALVKTRIAALVGLLGLALMPAVARAQQAAPAAPVDDGTHYFPNDSDSTSLPSGITPEQAAFQNSDSTRIPSDNPLANSDSTNSRPTPPAAPAPTEPEPVASAAPAASAEPPAPAVAPSAAPAALPSPPVPVDSEQTMSAPLSFAPQRKPQAAPPANQTPAPAVVAVAKSPVSQTGPSVFAEYEDLGGIFGTFAAKGLLWTGLMALATGIVFLVVLATRARRRPRGASDLVPPHLH